MNFKTMEVVASSSQGKRPDVKDLMKKQKRRVFDRCVFSYFLSVLNLLLSAFDKIEGESHEL